MNPQFKICPQCGTQAALSSPMCANCGRVYKTKFPEPPADDRTMFAGQAQQYQSPAPVQQQPMLRPSHSDIPGPGPQFRQRSPDDIQVSAGSHPVPLAAILGLLIFGAGQMVNRQYIKGVILFVLAFPIWLISFAFFLIPVAVYAIVCVTDAVMVGQRLNRGEIVGQWQFF